MTRAGSFTLRGHTADVAIAATGTDLGATFAACADGMTAAMCDDIPDTGERFSVRQQTTDKEALLFDYLDRLIYERDVRLVLPVDHDCTVTRDGGDWIAAASARGVPLDEVVARDVKAVTYSDMRIQEQDTVWRAYVVLDV